MQPTHMVAIIDGQLYDTEQAFLLAHDDGWEEHTLEQPGRCCFLYRMPHGAYFAQRCTAWEAERDQVQPLSAIEAAALYRQLRVQLVSFREAFPALEPAPAGSLPSST